MGRLFVVAGVFVLVVTLLNLLYSCGMRLLRVGEIAVDVVIDCASLLAVGGPLSGRVIDPSSAARPAFIGRAWMSVVRHLFLGTAEERETVGSTTAYSSRGAGVWGPLVRVSDPPETAALQPQAA